jgi:3-oxoacyl-[acyl-carrier protein] reductase
MITGAGRGIGRATAEAFAAEGYTIVLAEWSRARGRRVEQDLRRAGAAAHFLQTDVASAASIARTVRRMRGRLGRLDCVVNNAGVLTAGPLRDLALNHLERMLAVNLRGPLLVARATFPLLVRRRSGSIINVASQLGKVGAGEYVTYCATKFGVVGLTEALAQELGSTGVRVLAVCPGLVDTPMARRAVGVSASERAGLLRPQAVARVIVDLATGRRRVASGAAVDVVR